MRILIAEDEAISRNLLAHMLKENGYEVVATSSGAQAWEELQKPGAPRVAILDWLMPGLDGLDVVRRVRALERGRSLDPAAACTLDRCYLIMLSGRSEEEDVIIGLNNGADDYLVKPFHHGVLRARVDVGRRMVRLQEQSALQFQELRQSQADIKRHEARLESLLRINQRTVANVQELLDFALNEVIILTGSQLGYIYFYNEATQEFTLNSWSNEVMRQCSVAEPQSVYQLAKTGLWGESVRQGRAIMVNDFTTPHHLKKGLPEGHAPLRKFLTIPVFCEGDIVAVVGVANKEADYDEADILQLNLMMDAVWKRVQHKREEEALKESEQRFRLLMQQLHAGVVVHAADTSILLANQEAATLLGLSQAQLQGRVAIDPAWCFVREDGRRFPPEEYPVARAIATRQPVQDYVLGIVRPATHDRVWVLVNALPEFDDKEELRQIVVTFVAITELKEAEELRLKMEQQMLNTQKLESLGVLAGGIAHDFNNILMTVMGNASLALMRLSPDSPATENLRQIEQATDKAAKLAQQMLAYSGKGKFVIEAIDLSHLVAEMTQMLDVSITKKAVLRYNFGNNLPTVAADATQLRQIIMNLVINASEAIGNKSGIIAITTGAIDCDRSYLNSVWLDEQLEEGLYVFVEVADTGCGMDKETIARLFDPFFTTKFTGRGLGMAAVLGIVRGHKGAVKVYSEPGKGTTFKVLLPAAALPAATLTAGQPDNDWQGGGTVLLVDDEETVRAVSKQMLQALGFQVLLAEDGLEALSILKANENISCVILDLTMPHMGGEDAFRELRRLDPQVKIIMSSGYNEQEVSQKFAGKGLTGFIQKPYTLTAMRDVLKRVIG